MHTRHAYTYQQIVLICAVCDMAREFLPHHPRTAHSAAGRLRVTLPIVEVATQGGEEAAERKDDDVPQPATSEAKALR